MKRRGVAACCLVLAGSSWLGGAQADDGAERARIVRERNEAQSRFEQQQRECAQRFAVTSCVEEARAEHRQTLLTLRRQEGVLDQIQRQQRAAARLAAIEERQRAEGERAATPRAARPPAPLQVKPRPPQGAAPRAVPAAASGPEAAAKEQRNRVRFEARQREAQARREQAERRRAQRDSESKASSPLPDPGAR